MSPIPSPVPTLIAVFLIVHGLIHMSLATIPLKDTAGPRVPFFPSWWRSNTDPAWPASKLGLSPNLVRTSGYVLWMITLVLFVAAGLGLLGVPGLREIWTGLAAGGSVVSLVLVVLYWHPWYVAAPILDLAILAAAYFRWPAALFGV